jgi:hypothetical protein
MTAERTKKVSVTLTSVFLLSLVGCQKNSYQSCVDFQTEAATRNYKSRTSQSSGTLQKEIDNRVLAFCSNVK